MSLSTVLHWGTTIAKCMSDDVVVFLAWFSFRYTVGDCITAVVQAKPAGCGQSPHLDRPWMTSLPQNELTVDCEDDAEQTPPPQPPPPSTSPPPQSPSPSSLSTSDQQQQQLGAQDDGGKPSDSQSTASPPDTAAPADVAAGTDDVAKDDAYTCPRCEQEFHDETRYRKHCNKCCDD